MNTPKGLVSSLNVNTFLVRDHKHEYTERSSELVKCKYFLG